MSKKAQFGTNWHLLDIPNYGIMLKKLDCSYNKLTSISNEIYEIYEINELMFEEFYCQYNKIKKMLPIGPNMTKLNCSHNQLTRLFNIGYSLEELYCSHNNMYILPDNNNCLRILDCSFNKLTIIPKSIMTIQNLNMSNQNE